MSMEIEVNNCIMLTIFSIRMSCWSLIMVHISPCFQELLPYGCEKMTIFYDVLSLNQVMRETGL